MQVLSFAQKIMYKKPVSNGWKKGLKNLTLAFTLAASPFALPAAPALANHPDAHNPLGLWQAIEHNMIAEVEKCPDSKTEVCATVYRTSAESVDDAITREKERIKDGRPSIDHSGETSTYCRLFETTRATEKSKDVWESDTISMFIFNARLGMTLTDDTTAKGQANVRLKLFNAGITDINVTARKISPDGPEFAACRDLKNQEKLRGASSPGAAY